MSDRTNQVPDNASVGGVMWEEEFTYPSYEVYYYRKRDVFLYRLKERPVETQSWEINGSHDCVADRRKLVDIEWRNRTPHVWVYCGPEATWFSPRYCTLYWTGARWMVWIRGIFAGEPTEFTDKYNPPTQWAETLWKLSR